MKWVGRIVVGLLVILAIAAAAISLISDKRLNRTYDIPAEALALAVPSDPASIARGKHLSVILGCTDCHGKNLAGSVFLDVPPFKLVAPNLTRGKGGVGGTLSDADLVRAIRHGVAPDGRAFLVMPSVNFDNLSDADLGAIVAYVKSVPAVDRELPPEDVRPLGRTLLALGMLPPPSAAEIDHRAAHARRVQPAVTVDYGRYLAQSAGCTHCHRPDLTGGPIPGLPPDAPHAQNITPAGIGTWSDADFVRALRVGKRPDNTTMSTLMPWPDFGQMSDAEIKAVLLYVRSVPAKT